MNIYRKYIKRERERGKNIKLRVKSVYISYISQYLSSTTLMLNNRDLLLTSFQLLLLVIQLLVLLVGFMLWNKSYEYEEQNEREKEKPLENIQSRVCVSLMTKWPILSSSVLFFSVKLAILAILETRFNCIFFSFCFSIAISQSV